MRLYPASFRAEFGAEMAEVFEQASADAAHRGRGALARHCLLELATWPGALGREWAYSLQARLDRKGGPIMGARPSPRDVVGTEAGAWAPAPWLQAILATLALLVPGLGLAGLPGLPAGWHRVLVFGSYLFILLGLLAGWVRGFPRWSYAYLGYGLVFALWLARVATPGLRLLGHSFAPNEVWDWRAWLGLAAVAVFGLLLTRSLRPLTRLFTGLWCDWTRLSLALYGTLSFVIWVLFDEVHDPYCASFLIVTSLILSAGALAYMRSRTTVRRVLSLVGGLTASWLVSTVGLSAYWHGPRVPGRAPFHWSGTAVPMAFAWAVVTAILLMPVVLGLLHRVVHRWRPA
jgi:hypothetical protein